MSALQTLSAANTALCEQCDSIEAYFFDAYNFHNDSPDESVEYITTLDEMGILSEDEEDMLVF